MMLSAIIKLVRIGRVIASKVWILVCIWKNCYGDGEKMSPNKQIRRRHRQPYRKSHPPPSPWLYHKWQWWCQMWLVSSLRTESALLPGQKGKGRGITWGKLWKESIAFGPGPVQRATVWLYFPMQSGHLRGKVLEENNSVLSGLSRPRCGLTSSCKVMFRMNGARGVYPTLIPSKKMQHAREPLSWQCFHIMSSSHLC